MRRAFVCVCVFERRRSVSPCVAARNTRTAWAHCAPDARSAHSSLAHAPARLSAIASFVVHRRASLSGQPSRARCRMSVPASIAATSLWACAVWVARRRARLGTRRAAQRRLWWRASTHALDARVRAAERAALAAACVNYVSTMCALMHRRARHSAKGGAQSHDDDDAAVEVANERTNDARGAAHAPLLQHGRQRREPRMRRCRACERVRRCTCARTRRRQSSGLEQVLSKRPAAARTKQRRRRLCVSAVCLLVPACATGERSHSAQVARR